MPTTPVKPSGQPTNKFAVLAAQTRSKAGANPVAMAMWVGAMKGKAKAKR